MQGAIHLARLEISGRTLKEEEKYVQPKAAAKSRVAGRIRRSASMDS